MNELDHWGVELHFGYRPRVTNKRDLESVQWRGIRSATRHGIDHC
jgi:hypothetical protein